MKPERGSISISILNSADPVHPPGHRDPSITACPFVCRLLSAQQKSPRGHRNGEVCVAAQRLRQAAGGGKEKKTLFPQVMKPLPSQGSDKCYILPVLLRSVRRSSFSFFCISPALSNRRLSVPLVSAVSCLQTQQQREMYAGETKRVSRVFAAAFTVLPLVPFSVFAPSSSF